MTRGGRVQGVWVSRAALLAMMCVSACDDLRRVQSDPIAALHDYQGGAIAQPRLPPPNADGPYPNLASVPPRPVPTDPALRQSIADSLVADRDNANRLAAAAPIPDPTLPAASPAAFGRAPATPQAPALSASFDAATPAAPPPVPRAATAPAARGTAAKPAVALPVPIPAAPTPDTALPPLPTGAPAAPDLPGAIPVTAPRPLPLAPHAAAAPKPPAGPPAAIAFLPGAADVPETQRPVIAGLAGGRGAGSITVTGFGEATGADAAAQAAGVKLGLERAAAVGRLLVADGAAPALLRLSAQPAGTGAVARILPPGFSP